MKSILVSLIISFGLGACSNGTIENEKVISKVLSVNDFAEQPSNAQLLDVRTPDEWSQGIIAGAILIDYHGADFRKQVDKLDKKRPIYVYCAAGGRSGEATRLMQEMGFVEIYDLDGGMGAWTAAGKPVVMN